MLMDISVMSEKETRSHRAASCSCRRCGGMSTGAVLHRCFISTVDDTVLARLVRRKHDHRVSGAKARQGGFARFDSRTEGAEGLCTASQHWHGVGHPGAAADKRGECCDHCRHRAVCRRRGLLDMASRSRRLTTLIEALVAIWGWPSSSGMREGSDARGFASLLSWTLGHRSDDRCDPALQTIFDGSRGALAISWAAWSASPWQKGFFF